MSLGLQQQAATSSHDNPITKQLIAGTVLINGKPLLIAALDDLDLPLFKVALAAGASDSQKYQPQGEQQPLKIYTYVKQKVKSNAYTYKIFYKALAAYRRQQWRKYLFKMSIKGLMVGIIVTTISLNIFSTLESFTFSQATLQLFHWVLDNTAGLALLGLVLNIGVFSYKIHHNFNNPAKSWTNFGITLAYDIMTTGLKIAAYMSYLTIGISPIAGIFFVSAFTLDATRGIIKLAQALWSHFSYRQELRDCGTGLISTQQFSEIIYGYQRVNYKILKNLSNVSIAIGLTLLIATYCFMPITFLGTCTIMASITGLLGLRQYLATRLEIFFEARAHDQITKHFNRIPTFSKPIAIITTTQFLLQDTLLQSPKNLDVHTRNHHRQQPQAFNLLNQLLEKKYQKLQLDVTPIETETPFIMAKIG